MRWSREPMYVPISRLCRLLFGRSYGGRSYGFSGGRAFTTLWRERAPNGEPKITTKRREQTHIATRSTSGTEARPAGKPAEEVLSQKGKVEFSPRVRTEESI